MRSGTYYSGARSEDAKSGLPEKGSRHMPTVGSAGRTRTDAGLRRAGITDAMKDTSRKFLLSLDGQITGRMATSHNCKTHQPLLG